MFDTQKELLALMELRSRLYMLQGQYNARIAREKRENSGQGLEWHMGYVERLEQAISGLTARIDELAAIERKGIKSSLVTFRKSPSPVLWFNEKLPDYAELQAELV